MKVRGDGHNRLSIAFPNGSRIVGLPGCEGTTRGFSAVSLLLVDEASRVKDDAYQAMRPVLAGGEWRPVADEHAVRATGILLEDVDEGWRAVGAAHGDGAGMCVDCEGIAGRRAA